MRKALFLVSLAALVAIAAPPVRAGVDIDFGANVPLGDDAQLFFQISSHYYDADRPVVEEAARWWPNPDDVAVGLFIARRSNRPVRAIFDLRRGGLSWWDVGVRVGIPVDAWFVPVAVPPGPPFGRAYGYWRKHQRNPRVVFRLSDGEVRDLVAVRMVHEYYGAPVDRALAWRTDRRADIRELMVREYRGRHGDEKDRRKWAEREDHDRGRGREARGEHEDKGHGREKGKGKGRDHDRD